MIIDIHCHYMFSNRTLRDVVPFRFEEAPQSTAGETDRIDAWLAPRRMASFSWRLMRHMLGVSPQLPLGPETDRELDRIFDKHLTTAGPIDRYVLLAFDRYHTDAGEAAPLPRTSRDRGSDMITSNTLVYETCRAHPDRYLFGASIHPYRRNALDALDEVFLAGACLIKWLPLHQNINIEDPRSRAFLRRCGELKLPVLAHYCEEFTLSTNHREFIRLAPALGVLRELRDSGVMPPFIAAHVSTPVSPWGERESFRLLADALLGEFADAPLFADISAMLALAKRPWTHKLLDRQELHGKLLFGTDFPVPAPLAFWRRRLGDAYAELKMIESWPRRIARACQVLGFNEIVFHRAARLLPNLDHFAPLPDSEAPIEPLLTDRPDPPNSDAERQFT